MWNEAVGPAKGLADRPAAQISLVMVAAVGLLLGAYKLGLFGTITNKPAQEAQQQVPGLDGSRPAMAGGQTPVIPGMPVSLCMCPPAGSPSPTALPSVFATPLVTPSSIPAQPVFGLAWFHKPPQDGSTASDIASNNSYIHLTGAADIPFRDKLRTSGYKGPILTYVAMDAVEGPGPYKDSSATCGASYQGRDNQLAFDKGDFCTYIHPHESWFLHNSKGERIFDDYFKSGRITYLMNPGDPGWRAFSAARLQYIKDHWFYDGIWLDNVDVDLTRARGGVTGGDGTVQEYRSVEQWQQAVSGWLANLRAQIGSGYPLWANLVGGGTGSTSWDTYAPYLDGAMDESFAVSWLDNWRTPDQWQQQLERAMRWLDMGKGLVMVGQGTRDDTGRLDFTLASYMLVATNKAFFRYTRYDTYYEGLWLYPEYDRARALGSPLGPYYATTPNVWRRDFTQGYVEVDTDQHLGRLVLNP